MFWNARPAVWKKYLRRMHGWSTSNANAWIGSKSDFQAKVKEKYPLVKRIIYFSSIQTALLRYKLWLWDASVLYCNMMAFKREICHLLLWAKIQTYAVFGNGKVTSSTILWQNTAAKFSLFGNNLRGQDPDTTILQIKDIVYVFVEKIRNWNRNQRE